MTNRIDKPDNDVQAQFDEAARRLQAAEARVQALCNNPLVDETARQMARDAFEQARLLWLSSDVVMRSAAFNDDLQRHTGKRVVILAANVHVGESIALLLRLRGFVTALHARNRIDDAHMHRPAAAVIVDMERDSDKASVLAVDALRHHAGTRIIGMIPPMLENGDWSGFDTILVKPVSIDLIVQAVTGRACP